MKLLPVAALLKRPGLLVGLLLGLPIGVPDGVIAGDCRVTKREKNPADAKPGSQSQDWFGAAKENRSTVNR